VLDQNGYRGSKITEAPKKQTRREAEG